MKRVAVFVDAGYLYAGGSTSLSGSAKRRNEISIDVPVVVEFLSKRATEISNCELLRIYWYDGALNNDWPPTISFWQAATT